jgi:hypothetical protein
MGLLGFAGFAVLVLGLARALSDQVRDAQDNGHEAWGTYGQSPWY